MLTKTVSTGVVKAFLDWILSAKGQAIIAEEFIPVDDNTLVTES
jgi:ABC-type Fe3+ transport system substrate-binding protein